MLNLNPEITTLDDIRTQLRVIAAALDNAAYRRSFGPGSMTPAAGATAAVEAGAHDYINMPDAADTSVYLNLPLPPDWVDGNLQFTVTYSGDILAAATVIRLGLRSTRFKAGDVLTGTGEGQLLTATGSNNVPAPPAAKALAYYTYPEYHAVVRDSTHLAIVLTRPALTDALDTYNGGALRVLSLTVQYLPARRYA